MKCFQCGAELPEGSHFCNICGAKQNEDKSQENEIEQNEKDIPYHHKIRYLNSFKIIIPFCICLFMLLVAMTPIINSFDRKKTVSQSEISSIANQSSGNSNFYQDYISSEKSYNTNADQNAVNSDYLDDTSSDSYNGSTSEATTTNEEEPVADDEKGACWALAEDVVKSKLKSPSTAKLPFSYSSDGVSMTKSGDLYTVIGWVDAENSFGAELRSNFTVTMTKSGYGDNAKFTAESCEID